MDTDELNTVENYEVRVSRDRETGQKTSEIWTRKGEYGNHRVDEPAFRRWDRQTGRLILEAYYKNGKSHRIDGPARTCWCRNTGELMGETWCVDGILRRPNEDEDLPAFWTMNCFKTNVVQEYYWRGLQHRNTGPAEVQFNPQTGDLIYEAYYTRDELIREIDYTKSQTGPAIPYDPEV